MKLKHLAALFTAFLSLALAGPVMAQNPHYQSGYFTLAPGPDNVYDQLPPVGTCHQVAWVTDRPGGAGFMVSNCVDWVSDQGPKGDKGDKGDDGADGTNGTDGAPGLKGDKGDKGDDGTDGAPGPAGPSVIGSTSTLAPVLGTAYQAPEASKPALINVNLSSSAALTLTGGTATSADVVIGNSAAVASGTGSVVCRYQNTNTGALTLGLALTTTMTSSCSVALPAGWYYAIRQTSGTVTVTSAFAQTLGD